MNIIDNNLCLLNISAKASKNVKFQFSMEFIKQSNQFEKKVEQFFLIDINHFTK